jgi:hypothetical protein
MTEKERKDESPDWLELMRRSDDERYDKLAERVRKLEQRGHLLQDVTDERLYLILFGCYVFFAFVLPTLTGSKE